MDQKSLVVLLSVLLVGSLEPTSISDTPAELLATLNAVVIASYLVLRRHEVAIPTDIGVALAVIWGLWLVNVLLDVLAGSPLVYSVLRVPLFLFFVVLFLFVVPQRTSAESFLYLLPRFSAALTAIGLFALAVGGFVIGPLEFLPYPATYPVFPFVDGLRVQGMTAIFENPNSLAPLLAVGFVGALYELDRTHTAAAVFLVVLNGIGLRLAASRSAQLGALIAVGMYVAYRIGGRRLAVGALGGALAAIVALLGMQFGILPSVPPFGTISFNQRIEAWGGIFEAIAASPLIGLGLVPAAPTLQPYSGLEIGTHSGVLYQLLSTGVVGLTAYLYIYGRTLFGGVTTAPSRRAMTLYCVATVLLVTQTFDTYSMFGVTIHPAIVALSLGYAIDEFYELNRPTATEASVT